MKKLRYFLIVLLCVFTFAFVTPSITTLAQDNIEEVTAQDEEGNGDIPVAVFIALGASVFTIFVVIIAQRQQRTSTTEGQTSDE